MFVATPFDELTKTIIGCAMRVHGTLGNGFPEAIYQRCLALEIEKVGLAFRREVHLPVYYHGTEVGSRRVDFLVEEVVLLELKATSEITADHYAQTINYLKAYSLSVGLLINFGQSSLQFKRFLQNKTVTASASVKSEKSG